MIHFIVNVGIFGSGSQEVLMYSVIFTGVLIEM